MTFGLGATVLVTFPQICHECEEKVGKHLPKERASHYIYASQIVSSFVSGSPSIATGHVFLVS